MYKTKDFEAAKPEGAVFTEVHQVNGFVMAVEGTVNVGGRVVLGVWDSQGQFWADYRQDGGVNGFDEVRELPMNQMPFGEFHGVVVQQFPFFDLKIETAEG